MNYSSPEGTFNYSPLVNAPFPEGLMAVLLPIVFLVVLWSLAIKGFALWHAARNSQKWWFIVMLVINTIGILEIIYLIWFRPKGTRTPARSSSAQA